MTKSLVKWFNLGVRSIAMFLRFIGFCCLLLLQAFCFAQPVKNLVLEGAGVRGIAYVGAIKYLEEHNQISKLEKIGGTSAGAIAALMISLGYSAKQIENITYGTKLQKFNDGKFFFIGGISRLNRNYGWYRGKAFLKWLEKIIEDRTGNADITFRELHERQFKDLYVTGTSLNHQKLLVFCYETYPDMRIKEAVRISMSIPLYFEAVMIDTIGRVLPRKHNHTYYDLVVDGGFTGNFPIAIFDSTAIIDGKELRIPDKFTLGLRIDAPEQIASDSLQNGLAPIPINRFRNYVGAFYNYVIENLNRGQLTSDDWKRTVSISSGTIGPKIRKLSVEEKNLLIVNGYEAARKYFVRRDWDSPDN
jgi:NTE family protein